MSETPAPEGGKVFNDEDVKRLENWVDYAKGKTSINVTREMYLSEIEPLLARLEAAEWAMSELERHDRKGYLHSDLVEPLEAWRKASGKPQDGAR